MCFDARASFLAWSLSFTIAYYLFERNRNYDRWLAAFIVSFASIQLLEAGIWTSLTEKNGAYMNDLMTRLIPIALLSQPLIQTYMGAKHTTGKVSTFLYLFSFVMLGIFIYGWYRIGTSKPGQFHSFAGPHGHLVWKDDKSSSILGGTWITWLYLIGLFVPLLFIGSKGLFLLLIGIATALYSMKMAHAEEFSSYWCFSAVAFAIAALFV